MRNNILPDGKSSIRLLAIEIDVKFLQYLNGSFTMCSIALLSKFKARSVGAGEFVEVRHKTLKFINFFDLSYLFVSFEIIMKNLQKI